MDEEFNKINKINIPTVGKKRIAIYNGFLGQSERILINGQIVDIPFLENYLYEDFDIFSMLPNSLINRFRAIQDVNLSSVRNPKIQIDIIPMESDQIQKLLQTKPIASVDNIKGSQQGTFEVPLTRIVPKLESGKYLLRTNIKGSDSIRQSLMDLANFTLYTMSPTENFPIGFGRLSILPENYEGFIIISDIDKTFLNTKFEDQQGLLETLLERIENKKPVIGMDELFRQLKKLDYPLLFISASPTFFHRVLEGVFKRFQIPIEGLFLKKLSEPVANLSSKIFYILNNLNYYINQGFDEMFHRSIKFLNTTLQSFVDQTAYKLKVLLKIRKMQPSFSKIILIGDNTESDFLIFVLYQMLLTETIPKEEITDFLYNLTFKDKETISKDNAIQIQKLVLENLEIHGKINPVQLCLIHKAYKNPDEKEIYEILEKTLYKNIEILDKENIKLPIVYSNMWELSFELYKKNVIPRKKLKELLDYTLKIQPEEKEKIFIKLRENALQNIL
ncbi:MAG: phosphatase domain-containing protein [Leptonema sp. (in: bacteria)]